MQEERRTLFECIYSRKLNGELFFDKSKNMRYHIDEFFGDPLNLGSATALATYENGKSKFIYFPEHINDLEVITANPTEQVT